MPITIPIPNNDQLDTQAIHPTSALPEISHNINHSQPFRANSIDTLPLLLTVSEVSAALGLGRNSTYQLLRSGKLKSIRVGKLIKIPRAALEDYLNSY